eukprot:2717889-Rhodomonas_salina.2
MSTSPSPTTSASGSSRTASSLASATGPPGNSFCTVRKPSSTRLPSTRNPKKEAIIPFTQACAQRRTIKCQCQWMVPKTGRILLVVAKGGEGGRGGLRSLEPCAGLGSGSVCFGGYDGYS